MTPQGCYRYSPSSIIVPHNVSSILCDPSSHYVIPIPSQDHGESFTECRLQNYTDFADPEMTDQDPFFIASFLEACILFDPGGDAATLPTCDIKNVGVQTADDHLLVSRDSETTTDEEILHICPSLIHFVVTLEQQFITIDDLLTEEAIDPFTDNATAKDVIAKHYEPQDIFADPPSSCPEVPIGILMELSPALRNCINDGDGNSNAKREDPPFNGPLGACDTRNSMPFAPLWIIFSVMCVPSSHKTLLRVTSQDHGDKTLLRVTSQDHGEIFTDRNQKFVDRISVLDIAIFTDRNQKFINRISVLDIAAKNQKNDGYSIDPLVLEHQHGSACISAKVDIQVLMCLLARLSIGLSVCNGSLIVACDDHPLLSMHHLGHQSFPSMKYKQIQHNGTTSSFEPSTDYDTVNVIDLEWICQDPFGIKIKQVQCDGVAFSLFNVDVACAHHKTSQMLTRTSFPITLIADASKGGLASSASAALGSSVFSSMKGMLICGPKENGIFLQGTTTPLCAGTLLCVDPSMATSAQSSCHLTLLETIDTMANSFSYRDLMIDGLYGTKVLISPALMGER